MQTRWIHCTPENQSSPPDGTRTSALLCMFYANKHKHMRRTTIYLEPELEVLLKTEMLRQNRPMAEIVRDAVRAYVTREPRKVPPGAGAFASGRADTAERVDTVLQETGFGAATVADAQQKRAPRGSRRRPRR